MFNKILRLPAVKDKTGLSTAGIYLKISRGEFPRQIRLGQSARSVGWLEEEIHNWIEQRVHDSRAKEDV